MIFFGMDEELRLYIKEKMDILEELGVAMTDEDKTRMMNMDSEIRIDNFARSLIMNARTRDHVSL